MSSLGIGLTLGSDLVMKFHQCKEIRTMITRYAKLTGLTTRRCEETSLLRVHRLIDGIVKVWNHRSSSQSGLKFLSSLLDYLRCSDLSLETFKRQLKNVFICTLLVHLAH